MKISTILDHIDSGHMALPEFQRGYVWNRDQVRGLFNSLYRRYPVGGLLVWVTDSKDAQHRGTAELPPGVVKLILDGQQRMTTLYGVVRGRPPKFFDGQRRTFTDLMFHLDSETFEFFQPVKMRGDDLWVDVTKLMTSGILGLGDFIATLSRHEQYAAKVGTYAGRLTQVLGITDVGLHIEEVTGEDKSLDVVVEIFNRVNSGGTKLSKGDLALAKICADWPEARAKMKESLDGWEAAGYRFTLDWLLRSLNTVLTGEAKFQFLHDKSAAEVQAGRTRAVKLINVALNMIANRLGLDHDDVFFGRFAVPVMVAYLDTVGRPLGEKERDLLLFWFLQAGMWGRFSGSTETFIDQDLAALEGGPGEVERLIAQLRLWHGGLRVEPGHFTGWSLGARFYPVLYMLTRMGDSRDWGSGAALKANMLGKMSRLEVHHIFPKARLYAAGYAKPQVNALANFCFLTKDTNLQISDRLPEVYFPLIEQNHPGALTSQWIPADPELWRIDRYLDFLEARKQLLARATNDKLESLLHGDLHHLEGPVRKPQQAPAAGGIASQDEKRVVEAVQTWLCRAGLPIGQVDFELVDLDTGMQVGILDLAWPNGLQEELSRPVALVLNEGAELLAMANAAGYSCFTNIEDFRAYVEAEVLGEWQADGQAEGLNAGTVQATQ
jgi:hypothetical protein